MPCWRPEIDLLRGVVRRGGYGFSGMYSDFYLKLKSVSVLVLLLFLLFSLVLDLDLRRSVFSTSLTTISMLA